MLRTYLLVPGLMLAVLFSLAAPARAQALEVKAGSPLVIESLTVRADIDEGLALVDVDQVFRNDTDRVQEGVYRFRLPAQAVVHSFSMWIDGKEKHGRVLEAQRARGIYDSIVRRKRDPALLEEIGWRRFQVSVFPIPARDTVRIRLVYAHVVDDDLGLRTLEIPLPEGTPIGVADVVVRVRDREGVAVLDCPTHAGAVVLRDDTLGAVRWSQEGFTPTGPFRVRSAPAVKGLGLACIAYRAEGSDAGAFLVRVVPRMDDVPELPRDVVFVIDRSGSMNGRKLEQAQAALRYGLSTLKKGDRFAIVAFSSGLQEFTSDRLVSADESALDAARAFASALTASGGTNIDAALQKAMSLRDDLPGRLFVVSFLTDGQPTVGEKDPDRIVARYRARSAGAARLFAFGVGDDVKDFLLTRLAADSRGAAEYVRENEDLEVKLSALFDKVRSPVLTDVAISVTGDGVQVVGTEPEVVPDVFRGTAVVVAGRYTGSGPVTIHLTGRVGTTPVEARLAADLPAVAGGKPHVAQIWARMRIDRLLDDLRLHGMVREIRDEIIALGLEYQVVTPYTSFLVVEDGTHIPDDGELARVPEGPGGGTASGGRDGGGDDTGTAVHVFGGRNDGGAAPPDAPESGGPASPGGEAHGPTTGGGAGGGAYRGPSGEVPPDSREPSDTGSSVGGAGPSSGGGAAAGRPFVGRVLGFASWRSWWQTHRDSFHAPDRRALPDHVRDAVIVPALRDLALDDRSPFLVRSEALRALALWGDDAAPLRALALRMLAGETAAGERPFDPAFERAAPRLFLSGDLDGATRARLLAVLGDRARDVTVRAHAALTLGLGGADVSRDVARALLVAARENGPSSAALRPSALMALGLLGEARAVHDLAQMLADASVEDLDRVYVVDALGRLGATDQLAPLMRLLGDRKTAASVRRAIPAALARLAPTTGAAAQRGVVRALYGSLRRDRDLSTRNAAAIALGRIAASPAIDRRVRGAARNALLDQWRRTDATQPFVALALGIVARMADDAAHDALASVEASADPEVRAAAVIAIAMGAATDSPEWIAVARDRADDQRLRVSVLESMAWTSGSVPSLRSLLQREFVPEVRLALLRTLAMRGDEVAAKGLLRLVGAGTVDERVFDVLGRVGDAAVADSLVAVVRDERGRFEDRARGLAARALGRMAGAPDVRRRIADDFPYRAYSAPIWEFMDWR